MRRFEAGRSVPAYTIGKINTIFAARKTQRRSLIAMEGARRLAGKSPSDKGVVAGTIRQARPTINRKARNGLGSVGRGRWRAISKPIAAKAPRRNRQRERKSRGKMPRNLQREPLRRSQSASWNAPKQNAVASMWPPDGRAYQSSDQIGR